MDSAKCTPIHRIPGAVMPRENHSKNLTKLTMAELIEIKERECKLLENKRRLAILPDKGKRIRDYYDKVVAELERREVINETVAMFSELNIATKGKTAMNNLEWHGRINNVANDPMADVLDSDDEIDMDPLRVLAQQTMHERRVTTLPAEQTLITAEDLAEIEKFKTASPDSAFATMSESGDSICSPASNSVCDQQTIVESEIIEMDIAEKLPQLKPKLQKLLKSKDDNETNHNDMLEHVRYLIKKTETDATPQREKFKPYKTTISNVHDPAKERARKLGKHWEVTAATPPLIKHDKTQCLSLNDSVQIQTDYLSKLKDLHCKQAEDRLARRIQQKNARNLMLPDAAILKANPAFLNYRDPTIATLAAIEGVQRFEEAEEVHDPLDQEESGINYTVYK